jgi:UDP-N-acetyl-D-mannosaminuronic acid transferase (WecB/TagA/CpsF family)
MAAAAGVHRRDQLHACRIADVGVGAGHDDLAGFQRRPEAIERLGGEFRYYVANAPESMI